AGLGTGVGIGLGTGVAIGLGTAVAIGVGTGLGIGVACRAAAARVGAPVHSVRPIAHAASAAVRARVIAFMCSSSKNVGTIPFPRFAEFLTKRAARLVADE